MWKKLLLYLYLALSLVMMVTGYMFEEPYGQRRWILLCLTMVYGVLVLYGVLRSDKRDLRGYGIIASVLMMALILLAVEIYSKYAVNYFYHSLYVLLILYVIVEIHTGMAAWLSGFITLLSFIKFLQLISIDPTFANIALLVFFGSVQILVVVIGMFSKAYQEETRKTKALYDELLETHNQLKTYAEEIQELSKMEARTKIARDLHDTLGHEMTGLIMQMEMADACFESGDSFQGAQLLEASKQSARQSLVRVREIVETLKKSEDVPSEETSLQSLVDDFASRTGCRINYISRGEGQLNAGGKLVLYRVVQESLTNAVRHGKATEVDITLIYGSDGLSFEIANDGRRAEAILEGNGLNGMKDRVSEYGGDLHVEGTPIFRIWGHL